MLALDYSLGRIDTAESDVLDLFESPPVPITLTGSRPEPRTAYVCAVKKQSNVQVYVALAGEHGRNFVYTESDSSEGGTNYREALEQALCFAKSMGFAPERVNLDYTPAMRAVVVRNFKIFNFPGSATKKSASTHTLAYQKPALPQDDVIASPALVSLAVPGAMAATVASVAYAAKASPRMTSSAARMASSFVNERDRDEQGAVADVIVKFSQEMVALRAERDDLAARVQELAAAQLGMTAELKTAKAETDMLRAERDQLAESVTTLNTMSSGLAAMEDRLSQLTRERDERQLKHEELSAENEVLAESAARAKEEAAKPQQEAAGATQEAAKAQAAAAKAIEEAASAYEAVARAREEIATAQAEAARAKEEAATAHAEAAKAREEIAKAQKETDAEKEVAAKAQMEAARLAKERDVAATLTEELAQGKTTAGEEIKALLRRINAVSAERDAAISGAEELHRQLNAKSVELEATSTKLIALVEEREKLLTLGREQASLVAALEKRLAVAPVEVPQAVKDPLPVTAPLKVESGHSEQPERHTPEAGSLPVFEAPSKENAETAADPVGEQAFNFFEAETATFPLFSFGSEAAETAVAPVVQPSFGSFEADSPMYPDFAYEHADAAEPVTDNLALAAPSVPFVGFGPGEDSFFGGFSDDSETSTVFEPRFELTALEYSAPDEVVELHKSSNIASVAPDGNRQERCEGYICCLRSKNGLQVFAAIHGTQTGKIGMYAPVPQPSDERGVAAAVAGAITFHEQIGFMMEPMDLATSEQRSKAIASCPVLRCR